MLVKGSVWSLIYKVFSNIRDGKDGEIYDCSEFSKLYYGCNHSEISIKELLIILNDLTWESEEQLVWMLESLGFCLDSESYGNNVIPSEKSVYDKNHYDSREASKRRKHQAKLPTTAPPEPHLPVKLSESAEEISITISPLENTGTEDAPPEWLEQPSRDTPEYIESEESEYLTPDIKRCSLFPFATSRGVLSSLLSIQCLGREPDVSKVIDQIVRGEIVNRIPLITTTTMEQGCQLLLDYSQSMVPFWEDLNDLILQTQAVSGFSQVEVYEFDRKPNLATKWVSRKKSTPWRAKKLKPILVATNFGLNSHDDEPFIDSNWIDFIEKCRLQNAPLIFVTPWQKDYWPQVGPYPILIHWSPRTTASMVYNLVGKGRKVN